MWVRLIQNEDTRELRAQRGAHFDPGLLTMNPTELLKKVRAGD